MQETITNMMEDFMKNISSFQSFDSTKNNELFKDFNNSKAGLQLLNFQKNAFNNSYNTIVKIQEQSEKIADSFLKDNTTIPAEGVKMLNEWKGALKKGQEEFKKSVDDTFIKAEEYLSESKKDSKSK